ncbi:MAG: hypothetical protein ACLQI7_24835 [Streptosporangiaceae bacterium]
MPEDQPGQHAPKSSGPPDPFDPMHVNYVAVLELVRAFRRAGGGLIESSVMVAAQIAVNAAGGWNGKPDA